MTTPRIERQTCAACGGRGIISVYDPNERYAEPERCPDCEGCGDDTIARLRAALEAAEERARRAETDRATQVAIHKAAADMVRHTDSEFTAACNRADVAEHDLATTRRALDEVWGLVDALVSALPTESPPGWPPSWRFALDALLAKRREAGR